MNLNLLTVNPGVLPMQRPTATLTGLLVGLTIFQTTLVRAQDTPKPALKPQTRTVGERVKVDAATIQVDDGDSVVIKWPSGDAEIVRILGIDTPETRHLAHNIPFDQSHGPEAKAFAQGAFGAASEVQLLRCSTLDPFGRSLAYLFINGKNYSTLVIKAHLAAESVSIYGDNGLPQIAAEMLAAAKEAGPPPFEPPGAYRTRMRVLSEWLKKNGQYPTEKDLTDPGKGTGKRAIDEREAIAIAVGHLKGRGHFYTKYRAEAKLREEWTVLIEREPARPGDHVFVLVGLDGSVLSVLGGE